LPALVLLRKPLSGLANRRLQPGTLGEMLLLTKIKKYHMLFKGYIMKRGIFFGIIVFFMFSCNRNERGINFDKNQDETIAIESTIDEVLVPKKVKYITGHEKIVIFNNTVYQHQRGTILDKKELCEIEFGKEVEVLEEFEIYNTKWSIIKFENFKDEIPSVLLEENRNDCMLIDKGIVSKISGIYYYDHTNYISGKRENEIEIDQENRNDYVAVKWSVAKGGVYVDGIIDNNPELEILEWNGFYQYRNIYSTGIPDDYNIMVDQEYAPMKSHVTEIYFIEDGIVFRYRDWEDENNIIVEDTVYKK
jgi:hypothetical protein